VRLLAAAAVVLGACGGGGRSDVATGTSDVAATVVSSAATDDAVEAADTTAARSAGALIVDDVVNQPALDALATDFAALDEDQQFERLNELSGQLERDLYQFSGLTDALGSPDDVDASIDAAAQWFADVGAQLQSDIAAAQLQPVGLRSAAATPTGTPNLGEGLFGGMLVTVLGADAAVTQTNDATNGTAQLAEGVNLTSKDGTVELTSEHSSTDSHGVTTTLKTRNVATPCPAADGTFTASATIDTSSTINNGATGKHATMDLAITGTVDDNAGLVGYDITSRSQYADFTANKGGFLDLTINVPQTGAATATFNRTGGVVSQEIQDNAIALNRLMMIVVAFKLADAAKTAWESGRCVELIPTVSAGPTGLKPSASVIITAAPRSKIDGGPVGGTVTAVLSGGEAAVSPSSTPVPAAAEFTYDAPGERDKSGTVQLEARSKRGVAKATIEFDTKQAGYIASGGTTVTFTGTIPDLAAPFNLAGTGPGFTVEFSFTPTSAAAGSLSYTGSGGGATLTGSGTYTITGDDPNLLTLNYNAEGCADVGGCRSTSNAITLTAIT
jgi:hypothetical protein